MNSYITGAVIKRLREKEKITQAELAAKINVSAKAVSKWETGKGLPDISLIEPLAAALKVSVMELMSGDEVTNSNRSANMLRTKFYVCPVCSNVIHCVGEAAVSCCGVTLPPLEAEETDEEHTVSFDILEHTDIPIWTFRPTHLANKYDAAIRFARLGGYIDFTCDPRDMANRTALIVRAMEEAPEGLVTMSTDSNGSLPIWNEKKEMVGIGAASIQALHQTVKAMVELQHCPLEKAIAPATENVARALKLYPAKGCLAAGSDGDILLLDGDLNIQTVYAMGRCMQRDGVLLARANFEED